MSETVVGFSVVVSGGPNGFSILLGSNKEPLPITVELTIQGEG